MCVDDNFWGAFNFYIGWVLRVYSSKSVRESIQHHTQSIVLSCARYEHAVISEYAWIPLFLHTWLDHWIQCLFSTHLHHHIPSVGIGYTNSACGNTYGMILRWHCLNCPGPSQLAGRIWLLQFSSALALFQERVRDTPWNKCCPASYQLLATSGH